MASGNGFSSPLHLAANVPVIGELRTIGATVTTVMRCQCGEPVTLISQIVDTQLQSAPNACAGCHAAYAIAGMVTGGGHVSFTFARVGAPAAPQASVTEQ